MERIFKMRMTDEQMALLELKAKERGVDKSTFVRELVFSEYNNTLYNPYTKQLLYEITDILANQIQVKCNDEAFIMQCREVAKNLWHILNK